MDLKNVLIFGDSYSTFEGHIPEGYATYYKADGGATDVRSVNETWWEPLMAEAGTTLVRNDSWSGSTVCYTGYEGKDCSGTSSFIYRLHRLTEEGFFEKNRIDTVFLFGGTNDSWANAPLGELQYADWKKEDLYSVLPAICYFVAKVKETLPDARILCVINSDLKPEIINGFKTACTRFGVPFVALDGIDKVSGHPTVKGMAQIRQQVQWGLK